FGRVIPDDQAQAVAAAAWVRRLGVRRVEVVRASSRFGETLADAFHQALRGATITRKDAELVYYAGTAAEEPALAAPATPPRVMGSDALLPPSSLGEPLDANLATSTAQDPSELPSRSRRFIRSYRDRYGRAPGRY